MLMLLTILAAAAQPNPLNIPPPSEAEIMGCVPAEIQQGTVTELTAAHRVAIVSCAQALSARQINSRTPIVIDPMTTLMGVSASGPLLEYRYRVNVDVSSVNDAAKAAIEQSTRSGVCGNADMRHTMSNGGSYRYSWTDQAGRAIHQMTVESCS